MPLGQAIYASCPPRDFRNPALMDEYNLAMRRVVSSLSNRSPPPLFLDSDFITKPMWDSPGDWYHFENEAGRIEAIYIAATVLEV
jgi:hypothetical protein